MVTNPCWKLDGFLDEFRSSELTQDCWSVYREDLLIAGSSDRGYSHDDEWGLVLRPKAGPAWESSDSGFLLYQEVKGNFLLEAQVWVFGGAAPSEEAPGAAGARVGLLAYSGELPASGTAATDYYSIKVGTLDSPLSAGFEANVTSSENSNETRRRVDEDAEGWDNSYLRLCRVGQQLWSAYLPSGEVAWIPLNENGSELGYDTRDPEFPDLTETMVVGLLGELADAGAGDGSVRAILSRAEFSIPTDIDDCFKRF